MRRRSSVGCALVPLVLLVVPGCGGKGKPVRVNGSVTLDGKPLAGATVTFVPAGAARGRMAGGITDGDGQFRLTTFAEGDGALPGEYKVTVDLLDTSVGEKFLASQSPGADEFKARMMRHSPKDRTAFQRAMAKTPRSPVPELYRNSSTTPFQESVPTNGSVKLELSSAKGSESRPVR